MNDEPSLIPLRLVKTAERLKVLVEKHGATINAIVEADKAEDFKKCWDAVTRALAEQMSLTSEVAVLLQDLRVGQHPLIGVVQADETPREVIGAPLPKIMIVDQRELPLVTARVTPRDWAKLAAHDLDDTEPEDDARG